MRRLALVPLLLIASLLPLSAGAVGLGSIEMSSALNQRLDAEIPLRGVSPDQAGRVTVGLASERAFRDVGLPRPLFLTHLRFDVAERDGALFVRVTSRERITEPFLSFLVEVDAPSGSLRREYTVLLDPPVYATDEAEPVVEAEPQPTPEPEPEEVAEPAPAPEPDPAPEVEPEVAEAAEPEPAVDTRRRAQRFGDEPVFLQIERELDEAESDRRREAERLAAEEEARRERSERQAAEPDLPGSYETARGDTVWNIAARLADDETSVQQLMLALLRYNPEAFEDGNINRLRSGYVLRVPSAEQARAVDAQTAIAQVDRQNTLWREWRDQLQRTAEAPVDAGAAPEVGVAEAVRVADANEEARDELRIVGADDGGEVAAEDDASPGTAEASEELQLAREQLESTRMERDELASRVGELESTIDRMERLITVREEQLSALQDRLIEVAESEGVQLDPDMFPEEEVPEAVATAPEPLDIDIVTTDAVAGRLAAAAAERQDVLVAQAEVEAAAAAEEEAAADEEDEVAVAVVDDSGVQTERMQPQDEGWLGPLSGPLAGVLGVFGAASVAFPGGAIGLAAAGLAILALIALLLMRRRQDAAAEAAGTDADLDEDYAEDFADLIGGEEDHTEALVAEGDMADDGGLQDSAASDAAEDQMATLAFTNEDPLAALDDEDEVDASEGEKDDTIAEAEVYLAYGLHQQARDLLTLALQESPRRADYHEKLLETLYAAGEREAFESQAERFHQMIDGGSQNLWKRVVAMGREIAPDNALFRDAEDPGLSTADLRPEKPATTDFDLEGGEAGEVDLDFSLDDDSDMAATQVDFGDEPSTDDSAAGGFDQTVRMSADDASSAGLADGLAGLMDGEDEQQSGSNPEGTQFVGAGESESGDADELEFDLGDLEDFADESEPNQRQSATSHSHDAAATGAPAGAKDEAAGSDEKDAIEFDLSDFDEPAAGPAEDTGEAALGEADFDLDLESPPEGDEAARFDSTTNQQDTDDEFSFDISDLEAQEEETSNLREQQPASAAGEDATQEGADTAEFDLSDLESALDAAEADPSADGGVPPEPHASAESRGPSEDPEETVAGSLNSHAEAADIEFDLDELDSPVGAAEKPRVGTGNGGEHAGAADGGNNGRAAGLAAMEETGEGDDELDTMLDLARAYIDMGDEESATSALEEVVAGGSERQRQEAQKLLDSPR